MKLEFLDDISNGGRFKQVVSEQLVRLYDFGPSQAVRLRDYIEEYVLKGHKALDLSTLDFMEPVNCHVVFILSEEDKGLQTRNKLHFSCALTIASYQQMIYLMEPFCERGFTGFQWLYELDCEIDLLFSPGGTW